MSTLNALRIKARHHRVDLKSIIGNISNLVSDGEFPLRRSFGFSLRIAWQVIKLLQLFVFANERSRLLIGNKNNWPLKDGSGESEGTNTLFKQKHVTIPQVIQKKKKTSSISL